jgi:hypothetical protein
MRPGAYWWARSQFRQRPSTYQPGEVSVGIMNALLRIERHPRRRALVMEGATEGNETDDVSAVNPHGCRPPADCGAWDLSGPKGAVGRTTVIADGGYRGTCLLIPHRRPRGRPS